MEVLKQSGDSLMGEWLKVAGSNMYDGIYLRLSFLSYVYFCECLVAIPSQ